MNTEEFLKHVISIRKLNKNKWYFINEIVNGKQVQLKAFDTWLQIYKVDGINYSNCMDQSLKQFKCDLFKPFQIKL